MNSNSIEPNQLNQEQPDHKSKKSSDLIWGVVIGIAMSVFFFVLLGKGFFYIEEVYVYLIFSILLIILVLISISLKRFFLLLGISIIAGLLFVFFFVLWPIFASFIS